MCVSVSVCAGSKGLADMRHGVVDTQHGPGSAQARLGWFMHVQRGAKSARMRGGERR